MSAAVLPDALRVRLHGRTVDLRLRSGLAPKPARR